jgi:hypothetical protein
MFFSYVNIICSGLHSKNTEHQLYYSLLNTAEYYDIIHFLATDCSSYNANYLHYKTYTKLLQRHVVTYTVFIYLYNLYILFKDLSIKIFMIFALLI